MTRSVPEWIGKTDDARVPARVRLRVFLKYDRCCQCGCDREIIGELWDLDHKIALINGGEHRESNLQPVLKAHHKSKTRDDVAEKSRSYKRRASHAGVKPQRGRPMPGTYASGIYKPMRGPARWRNSGAPLGQSRP